MNLVKKPTEEDYKNMNNNVAVSLTGVVSLTAFADDTVDVAMIKAEKYDNLIAENPELLEL